jgi:hypothetical protein
MSIKGKNILQTLPRENRGQILGRIDFSPHRWKNRFRILHREEHVSYYTQGKTGFRSHREKIPFREEQLYKANVVGVNFQTYVQKYSIQPNIFSGSRARDIFSDCHLLQTIVPIYIQ